MHIPRPSLQPAQRRDVDDVAALLAHHQARGSLGAEERAFQVDPQDVVPVLFRQLVPGAREKHPGVVHQHVQAAKPLLEGAKHRLDLAGPGDIRRERCGLDAQSGDLPHRGLRLGA